jgi:uncharacterized UPF0160 family protein
VFTDNHMNIDKKNHPQLLRLEQPFIWPMVITETERNEMKLNEIYQNETKWNDNEIYRNETERNETKWNVHKNWKGMQFRETNIPKRAYIETYIKYIHIAPFCDKPSAWLFASFYIEIEKKKKSSKLLPGNLY